MARFILLPLALLAPIFAGCVAPLDDEMDALQEGAEGAALLPLALTYQTCGEQLGVFPVPMALARIIVPKSFSPVAMDPTGSTAILVYVSVKCDGIASDAAPAGEASETFTGIVADAPDEYRHADENVVHVVLLSHVTTSDVAQAAYESWGVAGAVGDVTFTRTDTPLVRIGTTTARSDGDSMGMRVVAEQAGGEEDGVARIFSTEGDAVAGGYDMAWLKADGASGQATYDEAVVAGMQLPILSGLGFLYWKEGDRYTKTPLPLPLVEDEPDER